MHHTDINNDRTTQLMVIMETIENIPLDKWELCQPTEQYDYKDFNFKKLPITHHYKTLINGVQVNIIEWNPFTSAGYAIKIGDLELHYPNTPCKIITAIKKGFYENALLVKESEEADRQLKKQNELNAKVGKLFEQICINCKS